MHPRIYREFGDILSRNKITGRVLEIGAVPAADTLLTLGSLRNCERIGVNMAGASSYDGFNILEENANDLSLFEDGHFDCVLSNATLEHDPYFWKTLSEVRRVLKTGGFAVIGVPGFTDETDRNFLGLPTLVRALRKSTLTHPYHGHPNDYYRFSLPAVREVFFEGFRDVAVRSVMIPPRVIGCGFRK